MPSYLSLIILMAENRICVNSSKPIQIPPCVTRFVPLEFSSTVRELRTNHYPPWEARLTMRAASGAPEMLSASAKSSTF